MKEKKPQRVFVCSMADLFGEWVPDEWIEAVFKACEAAPQHTYYFLTKNPKHLQRSNLYGELSGMENWWFGFSASNSEIYINSIFLQMPSGIVDSNLFVSLEPLLGKIDNLTIEHSYPKWVIVGAQSNPTILPEREWILDIRKQCDDLKIPLFEKDSLTPLDLPGGLRREIP
jgi:protein gp37